MCLMSYKAASVGKGNKKPAHCVSFKRSCKEKNSLFYSSGVSTRAAFHTNPPTRCFKPPTPPPNPPISFNYKQILGILIQILLLTFCASARLTFRLISCLFTHSSLPRPHPTLLSALPPSLPPSFAYPARLVAHFKFPPSQTP